MEKENSNVFFTRKAPHSVAYQFARQDLSIPAERVFCNLKKDLGIEQVVGSSGYSLIQAQQGRKKLANVQQLRFCSKYLGNDHLSSACLNKIRCLFWFHYSHKANTCFRKKVASKYIWARKKDISNLEAQPNHPDNLGRPE